MGSAFIVFSVIATNPHSFFNKVTCPALVEPEKGDIQLYSEYICVIITTDLQAPPKGRLHVFQTLFFLKLFKQIADFVHDVCYNNHKKDINPSGSTPFYIFGSSDKNFLLSLVYNQVD